MNHKNGDIPRFDDAHLEAEWQSQENAMRRERLHLDSAGDDSRSQRYRLLLRTLKAAPVDNLPADFAKQVSALAAAQAGERGSTAPERMLATVLASALLLAAVVVTVIYGSTWWPPFEALLPAPASAQWLLALIVCLGISWFFGAWSQLTEPANGAAKGSP